MNEGRWAERARRIGGTRFAAFGLALATAAALFTLGSGFAADDHAQLGMVRRGTRASWDLFSFYVSRAETLERIRVGEAPWFVDPGIQHAFFRPLASLGHFVDYRLFVDWPILCHAHSVLWVLALFGVVAWLFRTFERGEWTFGVAAALYACSPPIAHSAAWLASRNILMATAFGMAALGAHHCWRTGLFRRRAVPLALFAASLACGESSAGPLLYLLSYAALFETGPRRARLVSVLPYAVLAVAFWGLAQAFGYGVARNQVYVDVSHGLVARLPELAHRFVVLYLYEFGWGHAEVLSGGLFTALPLWAVAIALGMSVVLGVHASRDRQVRFWLVGAVTSLVPFCLTLPQPRLLAAAHVGFSMAFARLLAHAATGQGARWLVLALVLAPFALSSVLFGALGMYVAARLVTDISSFELVTGQVLAAFAGRDAIFLNADWLLGQTPRLVQEVHDLPQSRSAITLANAVFYEMERPDPRTLVVRSPLGVIGARGLLLRSAPLLRGDRVQVRRAVVHVVASSPATGPTEVRYEFDAPLEDPSLVWFVTIPPAIVSPVGPPMLGMRLVVGPGGSWFQPIPPRGSPPAPPGATPGR